MYNCPYLVLTQSILHCCVFPIASDEDFVVDKREIGGKAVCITLEFPEISWNHSRGCSKKGNTGNRKFTWKFRKYQVIAYNFQFPFFLMSTWLQVNESQVTGGWVTEVSTIRGHNQLVVARRQEQSPPQVNDKPIADLVGYQLRSQTCTCKMLSSSLAPPIPKTCIHASTHPSPYAPCTKTEAINRSPSTCQTTLSFSFCCLNKHASEQLWVGY